MNILGVCRRFTSILRYGWSGAGCGRFRPALRQGRIFAGRQTPDILYGHGRFAGMVGARDHH